MHLTSSLHNEVRYIEVSSASDTTLRTYNDSSSWRIEIRNRLLLYLTDAIPVFGN